MPRYYNDEYDIEKAFRAIEDELISSMMRNLKSHRAEETEEGYNWSMWQTEQLKALEQYKKANESRFTSDFSNINDSISFMLKEARAAGGTTQEQEILKAIKNGFKAAKSSDETGVQAAFFKLNTRKLNALAKATKNDLEKAEHAMLRMSNDKYRQIIFNAQVYANTGAGTYAKAVDMATKDFLSAGINCVEYKNGSRHTLKEYSKMAIQTANKRAYLTGEGEKRQEWGITTVIMNKRGNACPKCLPFVGKVLIDDVWSGGKASDGPYTLMSSAMKAGLYHPNCKDSHTTYFPDFDDEPDVKYTKKELSQIEDDYKADQQQMYAERQAEKYDRLSKYSLDDDNKKVYSTRAEEWKDKVVANTPKSDILDDTSTRELMDVHSVGKIDKDIYRCVTQDIVTDDVVITDRQIQHIKERHPNDFERYEQYFKDIVEKPDYIIEANKPSTALVLKEIVSDGEVFKTVVRLATSNDPSSYKNSIITFMKIDEKEWNRLLRNKKILYKKE